MYAIPRDGEDEDQDPAKFSAAWHLDPAGEATSGQVSEVEEEKTADDAEEIFSPP